MQLALKRVHFADFTALCFGAFMQFVLTSMLSFEGKARGTLVSDSLRSLVLLCAPLHLSSPIH